MGAYVIARAIDTVVRAASHEHVPFLDSREFEDELVRPVRGYLIAAG